MIESTKLKIRRGFEKAGEKASSTAGNVTSGVKTVIRRAQHILIILNPPATKNNGRIDTKHQI